MTINVTGSPPHGPEHGFLVSATGSRNQGAFTLLEMSVVIALLAILASATYLTPVRWFRSAQVRNGIDQIVMVDRLARQQAVRSARRMDLNFDLSNGSMIRTDPQLSKSRSHRMKLPSGLKMARLVTASQPPVSFGKTMIPCSDQGHSPTYALLLEGPDHTEQWIVIAGLTGQAVMVNNEKEVNALLQQLVP